LNKLKKKKKKKTRKIKTRTEKKTLLDKIEKINALKNPKKIYSEKK
jgi:hypothetical protein